MVRSGIPNPFLYKTLLIVTTDTYHRLEKTTRKDYPK